MDLYNIIGFLGVTLYVLAYSLLQAKKINQGKVYTLLNMFGALFILVSLIKDWNAPSFATQTIWVLLSIIGLYLSFKENKTFDELHIVFDNKTKKFPTHFILMKKKKIIKIFTYTDKNFWKLIKKTNNIYIKNNYFYSIPLKIPSYTNPPSKRNKKEYFENRIKIVNNDGVSIYQGLLL